MTIKTIDETNHLEKIECDCCGASHEFRRSMNEDDHHVIEQFGYSVEHAEFETGEDYHHCAECNDMLKEDSDHKLKRMFEIALKISVAMILLFLILGSSWLSNIEDAQNRDENFRRTVAATIWISAIDQCIESRKDGAAQQDCFGEIPVNHFEWLVDEYNKRIAETP